VRIVVADDHPLFLLGLRHGLEAAGAEVVAAVENGILAVEACRDHSPDVALLDVRMPRMDGLEACRTITRAATCGAVIILTTWVDAHVIDDARAAGARGFLSKEQDARDIVEQARRLLDEPELLVFPPVHAPELSQREMQVLDGLARGLTRKRIAKELGLSPETVKDHTASLFAKLDAHDRVTAVTNALSLGVMPLPPVGGSGG
jgi:two-component system, NarL family, nitrate/nitrite response regulator NarL